MEATSEQPKCELCGEPMPPGEEMFKFHGYSGPCPKPPLPKQAASLLTDDEKAVVASIRRDIAGDSNTWSDLIRSLLGIIDRIERCTGHVIKED